MRITNKDYTVSDVLCELMSAHTLEVDDTKKFNEKPWRSHDFLLQEIEQRIEWVLDAFDRAVNSVKITQGLRDNGVDILLEEEHEGERKVGIQVKSQNEAENDLKSVRGEKESMVAVLKRQAFEASQKAGVAVWWILLAFDEHKHRRQIHTINSELQSSSQNFRMRIFGPRHVLSLLSLTPAEIDAITILLLCREDPVLRAAIDEADAMPALALDFVLETLAAGLDGHFTIPADHVSDHFSQHDEPDGEAEAVEWLEAERYLATLDDPSMFLVKPAVFPSLSALYFDGRSRFALSDGDAADFVAHLIRRALTSARGRGVHGQVDP
jgi:hypothetical protein